MDLCFLMDEPGRRSSPHSEPLSPFPIKIAEFDA